MHFIASILIYVHIVNKVTYPPSTRFTNFCCSLLKFIFITHKNVKVVCSSCNPNIGIISISVCIKVNVTFTHFDVIVTVIVHCRVWLKIVHFMADCVPDFTLMLTLMLILHLIWSLK